MACARALWQESTCVHGHGGGAGVAKWQSQGHREGGEVPQATPTRNASHPRRQDGDCRGSPPIFLGGSHVLSPPGRCPLRNEDGI